MIDYGLVDHIAATIRRVDGNHTMGAAELAEQIVSNLPMTDYDVRWAVAYDELAIDPIILEFDNENTAREIADITDDKGAILLKRVGYYTEWEEA